jgi:polysaccharide biosynthesis protein PelA
MSEFQNCLDPCFAEGQTRRVFLKAGAGLLSGAAMSSGSWQCAAAADEAHHLRWLAFYGVSADEAVLACYDIVVLDPGFQGSISLVSGPGTRACGYISLAEIKTTDRFFSSVDPEALLSANSDWEGTRRVDLRHPSWRSLILDRYIPSIAARGFTGLMLDTLDTAPFLERQEPSRYRGMATAAIELVKAIRVRWPGMTLIMNRGYELLPQLASQIDAVIAESFLTSPDAEKGFVWLDARQVELQLSLLRPAVERIPPLPILSLDYWHPDDARTISEIYRRERELGHHPYVATRLLDRIMPEAG